MGIRATETIAVTGARGYAICTEPRTGSNFLCQLLSSTGVLGRPLEYFNAAGRRAFDAPDYPDDPEAQLKAILTLGATSNGIYALKLFSRQFDQIAQVRWSERLPGLGFIHLERRDLVGQAISWVRASQTGRYRNVSPGTDDDARYDRAAITERLREIVAGQARWRLYFARNGITALPMFYEDVVADSHGAVNRVANLMGVSLPPMNGALEVGVDIQRDALNEGWRAAYLADAHDLARLDKLQASGLSRAARWIRRFGGHA